jgi:DHA3 family macrolide efflux protein-like MFS transporter
VQTARADPDPRPAPLGRRFLTVWAGQTLSSIGSAMSMIGVAVYVFLETGSAVWLGVLTAVSAVPAIVVAPLGGLIDRYPRRTVMIAADCFAAVGPGIALVLTLRGELHAWQLALAGLLAGFGNAVQGPAAQAAVPELVSSEALGRANGLNQLGPALGFVVGPMLATPLVAAWGIRSVLILDAATFLVAVTTTLGTRFGAVPHQAEDDDCATEPGVVSDRGWRTGWTWLRTQGQPLISLMIAMALVNCCLGFYNVAIEVVAIDVGHASRSGLVFGSAGAAMVAGSLWIGRRGVPDRRIRSAAVAVLLVAVGGAVVSLRPWLGLIVVGAIVALVRVPAINASVSTIFHERVPAELQGRVFGIRFAIARSLDPIGALLGGVLVGRVAEPAMADGSIGAGTLGRLIGSGPGRGAAAVLLVVSVALGVLAVWLARSASMRQLDAPAGVTAPGRSAEPVEVRVTAA